MTRRTTSLMLALVLLTGLVACERGAAPGRPDDAGTDPDESVASSDLRLAAERSLGLHTLTIAESLRNAVLEPRRSSTAWAQAAAEDLAGVVAPFDENAADDVSAAWDELAQAAHDFAAADDDQRDAARDDLDGVAEEAARVLAAATDGAWEADEATSALSDHVAAIAGYVDAVAEEDHETALTALRKEHARMVAVGTEWAAALADPHEGVDPAAVSAPAAELRSALTQLLTEQAALTGAGMRRVARGARDTDATLAAVNGNTNDLVAAMRVIFGAGVARDLERAWRGRVELSVVDAAGLDDEAEQERAAQGLRRNTGDLVEVLSEATGDALDGAAASAAVRAQTRALHAQVVASADGRDAAAVQAATRAHAGAAELADLLTTAIIDDQPGAYPS